MMLFAMPQSFQNFLHFITRSPMAYAVAMMASVIPLASAWSFQFNVGDGAIVPPEGGINCMEYIGAPTSNPPWQNQSENPGGTHTYGAGNPLGNWFITMQNTIQPGYNKLIWLHLQYNAGHTPANPLQPQGQPFDPNMWAFIPTTGTAATGASWVMNVMNGTLHIYQTWMRARDVASEQIIITQFIHNGMQPLHQPDLIEVRTCSYPVPGVGTIWPLAAAALVSRRRRRSR